MTTKTTDQMNASQRRAFNNVLDYVTMHGHYEVKELEVTMMYGDAYVHIETGMPNDEGTLAECLCRDFYIFFIGKRGGLYTYNDNSNRTYIKYYDVRSTRR